VSFAVDPALVNPPGINCLNGRITISWEDKRPSWQLAPHNHEVIYTYVSEFEFNPNADPTDCDRLLSCLEPAQRDIFIKTLAASLDLDKIRLFKSRVRALLCKGDGNNGKDSLREAVQALYGGMGVVSATFNDFHQYDTSSHKFTLAKLEHARISWSSENSNLSRIDSLQSLKAAITGDTLSLELKNVNERPMNPRCIFLFNINDMPRLQASLEANESRWAVLTFDKTFKLNADPNKGEIEADPRFKYDPTFLQTQVVPALLNKMLAALPDVAANGIDYSCTEEALQEIRRENNHLLEFCQEVGLDYQVGGQVFIGELYDLLFQWYLDNGYVEITTDAKGKQKNIWNEPIHRDDKLVKASHQVFQRFSELFPKIKREEDKSNRGKKGSWYLSGINIGGATGGAIGGATGGALAPSQSQGGASGAILSTLRLLIEQLKYLDEQQVTDLVKQLESKYGLIAPLAPLVELARVEAPPMAPPEAPLSSTDDLNAKFTVNTSSAYNEGSTAVVANAIGEIGSISQDNHNNFFGNTHPFKIGSKVAHVDPKRESYNWHGTITEINADKAKVHWEERKGLRGGQVLTHRLSDLRLI
jgi:phage/plasmid-associated DNA primase